MNEEEIFSIIKDSTIMRNPMVRIPLEAYFREQFAKKEQKLKDNGYPDCETMCTGSDIYAVKLVDYEWAGFLFTLACNSMTNKTAVFESPVMFSELQKKADKYIDLAIKTRLTKEVADAKDIIKQGSEASMKLCSNVAVITGVWLALSSLLGYYIHPTLSLLMNATTIFIIKNKSFWEFLMKKCGIGE